MSRSKLFAFERTMNTFALKRPMNIISLGMPIVIGLFGIQATFADPEEKPSAMEPLQRLEIGLEPGEYQKVFDELVSKKYMPVHVLAVESPRGLKVTALFTRVGIGQFAAQFGMNRAEFKKWVEKGEEKLGLVQIMRHGNGKDRRYSGIMRAEVDRAEYVLDLSRSQLVQRIKSEEKRGYYLTTVNVSLNTEGPVFVGLFAARENKTKLEVLDGDQALKDFVSKNEVKILSLSGYHHLGKTYYFVIHEEGTTEEGVLLTGCDAEELKKTFQLEPQREYLAHLCCFGTPQGTRYTALWQKWDGFGNPKVDLPEVSRGEFENRWQGLDELARNYVRENRPPGMALAVGRNGKVFFARGYGYADPSTVETMEPDSIFRIASISKPITAVAVMKLLDEKKLILDEKVFEILKIDPHLSNGAKFDERWNQITVRHLLQHRGGWDRDRSFDPMFRAAIIARELGGKLPPTQDEIIRYMGGIQLDFDPGSRYSYSNFGYLLLGKIISAKSGTSYSEFVKESILKPAGMNQTLLGRTEWRYRTQGEVRYEGGNELGAGVTKGTVGTYVPLPYGAWDLDVMDAHGGWLSTAPDLVRFGGKWDQLISPEIQEMAMQHPDGKTHSAGENYNGLGWNVTVIQSGKYQIGHTGSLDGTSTILVRRADGVCMACLFNTRNTPKGDRLSLEWNRIAQAFFDTFGDWPE